MRRIPETRGMGGIFLPTVTNCSEKEHHGVERVPKRARRPQLQSLSEAFRPQASMVLSELGFSICNGGGTLMSILPAIPEMGSDHREVFYEI